MADFCRRPAAIALEVSSTINDSPSLAAATIVATVFARRASIISGSCFATVDVTGLM